MWPGQDRGQGSAAGRRALVDDATQMGRATAEQFATGTEWKAAAPHVVDAFIANGGAPADSSGPAALGTQAGHRYEIRAWNTLTVSCTSRRLLVAKGVLNSKPLS